MKKLIDGKWSYRRKTRSGKVFDINIDIQGGIITLAVVATLIYFLGRG